jgi:hypothetical protein
LFSNEAELGLSQLVEVELISALSRRVRMKEITHVEATAIAKRFQTDSAKVFNLEVQLLKRLAG